MTEDPIVHHLTQYGLTIEEAKVYVALAKIGFSKASYIATRLGYDRVKTYRILNKLLEKGVVESSLSKPMLFTATPLEKAVEILIQEFRDRVRTMEAGKEPLLVEWSRIPTLMVPTAGPRFKIHQGRLRIYGEMVKMIKSAKRDVLLLTTRNDLLRMIHAGVYDALVEASRVGIDVKILSEIDKSIIEAVKEYEVIAKIRHMKIPGSARFFTVDESEILISATPDDSMRLDESRDSGLWTDAVDFVRVIRVFFQEAWGVALNAEDRIREIVTGVPVEELLVVHGAEECKVILNRMLASAKTEATFIVNIPDPILLTDNIWQMLPGLVGRGVRARILTTVATDNLEKIKQLGSLAQVRYPRSRLGLQIIVVDRREVLMTSQGENIGANLWSDVKAHVQLIVQLVDNLWSDGLESSTLINKLEAAIEVKGAIRRFQEELNRVGWGIEHPSVINGASGVSHSFDVLIRNLKQPSQFILADIKPRNGNVSTSDVVVFYSKIFDVNPSRAFLLTLSDLTVESQVLVKLYNIEVVSGKSVEEILERFLQSILPTDSEG